MDAGRVTLAEAREAMLLEMCDPMRGKIIAAFMDRERVEKRANLAHEARNIAALLRSGVGDDERDRLIARLREIESGG